MLRESGAAVFISVIIMGGGSRSDFVLLSFPASIKRVNQFKLDSQQGKNRVKIAIKFCKPNW